MYLPTIFCFATCSCPDRIHHYYLSVPSLQFKLNIFFLPHWGKSKSYFILNGVLLKHIILKLFLSLYSYSSNFKELLPGSPDYLTSTATLWSYKYNANNHSILKCSHLLLFMLHGFYSMFPFELLHKAHFPCTDIKTSLNTGLSNLTNSCNFYGLLLLSVLYLH